MGFYDTFEIAASGMSAERLQMDVIANNIANANTTRTAQGGAFKRQLVIFAQKPAPGEQPGETADGFTAFSSPTGAFAPDTGSSGASPSSGSSSSDEASPGDSSTGKAGVGKNGVEGVEAVGIVQDTSPDRLVFDPGNPEADARGYVHYPNVQMVNEMVDLMAASRAYEADVAVIESSKAMKSAATGILNS